MLAEHMWAETVVTEILQLRVTVKFKAPQSLALRKV